MIVVVAPHFTVLDLEITGNTNRCVELTWSPPEFPNDDSLTYQVQACLKSSVFTNLCMTFTWLAILG